MRHGFATHLLKRGCPLPGIQKLLGHSQVSTTAQYIEIEDQQLKERLNLARNPSFLRNTGGV
jgi:site-specific recombinase XerD